MDFDWSVIRIAALVLAAAAGLAVAITGGEPAFTQLAAEEATKYDLGW